MWHGFSYSFQGSKNWNLKPTSFGISGCAKLPLGLLCSIIHSPILFCSIWQAQGTDAILKKRCDLQFLVPKQILQPVVSPAECFCLYHCLILHPGTLQLCWVSPSVIQNRDPPKLIKHEIRHIWMVQVKGTAL